MEAESPRSNAPTLKQAALWSIASKVGKIDIALSCTKPSTTHCNCLCVRRGQVTVLWISHSTASPNPHDLIHELLFPCPYQIKSVVQVCMFGYWWVANGNVHTIASSPGWKAMYTLQVSPTLARCMRSTLQQNNGSFLHHGRINKSAGWQKSQSMSGDINHEKSVSLMHGIVDGET